MKLAGKTALVTGGARGIGAAIAARLRLDMLEFGCGNWSAAPHLDLERMLGRMRGIVDRDEPGISQRLHRADIDRDIAQRRGEGAARRRNDAAQRHVMWRADQQDAVGPIIRVGEERKGLSRYWP